MIFENVAATSESLKKNKDTYAGQSYKLDYLKNPLMRYLEEYVGVKSVHWFKALSPSQTIEKLEWLTNKSVRFERKAGRDPNSKALRFQIVVNLGFYLNRVHKFK